MIIAHTAKSETFHLARCGSTDTTICGEPVAVLRHLPENVFTKMPNSSVCMKCHYKRKEARNAREGTLEAPKS